MYGLGSEPPCPWQCRQRDAWSGRCRLRGEAREGREAIILSLLALGLDVATIFLTFA